MTESGPHEWINDDAGDTAYQKSQGYYLDWAKSYNEILGLTGYSGPSKVADILMQYFPDHQRSEVRVLDVGAGTGLVGKELKARGFKHIDGIDPSEAMLGEARKAEVYENYISEYISGTPSDIPDNTYDALTGCGIFSEAHVPCEALVEMVRLVKPDGFIIVAISSDFLGKSDTYKRLEPLMDKLEADDKWKKVSSAVFPNYHGEETGVKRRYCAVMGLDNQSQCAVEKNQVYYMVGPGEGWERGMGSDIKNADNKCDSDPLFRRLIYWS